jgi:phage terminase large subunit GpA-like protein
VIADEVDAFPWDVGGEGDPMTLIENRQRTYSRAKTYLVSTPTTAGASRIDLQYQRSDRRRYHVPCPHCHERQHLEFGGKDKPWGLKWRVAPQLEGEDASAVPQVSSAWYVCRHCGAEIDEGHKADMLARGQWVAERPAIKHHRGYHLNALYAPVGLGLNWRAVAQKWLASQSDSSELKSFVNTYLGEVWKEQGDNIEDLSLLSRCEDYPEDLRSTRIALVTSFTDVQKDRLETTIVGWGPGEEAWVLDHEIHPGDTARPECWEDLDGYLRAEGVQVAGIDAGYNTSMVQAFVEKRRWCVATKGVAGLGRPLIEDRKKRLQRLRTRRKKGQPLEPLGVDQGKALVYARCKLLAPGPGYIHFPRSAAFDDEWFAQLAAEKLVTKIKGTRPFQEWVQTRPRNEALDCMVGNLAMMRLSGSSLVAEVGAGDTAMQQLVAANAKAKPKPRHPGGFVKGWKA